ncbi:hypothetical protein QQP08_004499 [Theobroma cacao]|nr:hypothetical protein QQP08_004499 [Theobroma cacao]
MENLVKKAMMGPIKEAIKEDKNGKDICKLQLEDLRPIAFEDFKNSWKEVMPSLREWVVFVMHWKATRGKAILEGSVMQKMGEMGRHDCLMNVVVNYGQSNASLVAL